MVLRYSLCGDLVDRTRHRLGVLLNPDSRGGSSVIHTKFLTGNQLVPGNSFELVAQRSGITVQVAAEESMVTALAPVGLKVDVSCQQGARDTCMAGMVEGGPDHRDTYVTAEERKTGDQVLLCCSRAKGSRLVVDL